MSSESVFTPDWPAPSNVRAWVSTRFGGCSQPPFAGFNLALHVEDDAQHVDANRQQLLELTGLRDVQWLEQVHGIKVVEAADDGWVRTADASITSKSNLGCGVLTADCLPLLICDGAVTGKATQVAAVHAGWRGLAAGIVAATIERFAAPAEELLVYLGPAISQQNFEVGIEVLEAFFDAAITPQQGEAISRAFIPSPAKPMHYCADLYALAKAELTELGVKKVYGGSHCTYAEQDRFFSYRREARTGRQVSLIALTD